VIYPNLAFKLLIQVLIAVSGIEIKIPLAAEPLSAPLASSSH